MERTLKAPHCVHGLMGAPLTRVITRTPNIRSLFMINTKTTYSTTKKYSIFDAVSLKGDLNQLLKRYDKMIR